MNMQQIEELLSQACVEGVIEIECKECGTTMIAEVDATDLYCQECKRIVMQNPLTEMGFI